CAPPNPRRARGRCAPPNPRRPAGWLQVRLRAPLALRHAEGRRNAMRIVGTARGVARLCAPPAHRCRASLKLRTRRAAHIDVPKKSRDRATSFGRVLEQNGRALACAARWKAKWLCRAVDRIVERLALRVSR